MSSGITITMKGNFKKLDSYLEKKKEIAGEGILDECGRLGVEALRDATPKRTGKTAASWGYRIVRKNGTPTAIEWYNTNRSSSGECIALLIQYGHGTQNGGYIEGRDYINPALEPIFDEIAERVIKEVNK